MAYLMARVLRSRDHSVGFKRRELFIPGLFSRIVTIFKLNRIQEMLILRAMVKLAEGPGIGMNGVLPLVN